MQTFDRQTRRFKWFYWLSVVAIALNAVPTAVLQVPVIIARGMSNGFGATWTFIHVPLSFIAWQVSLVFLYLSGRTVAIVHLREVVVLNVLYVAVLVATIGVFFVFPARFY
jgi:hypothetical protein